jgi:quercetin dioxygenase-like cupin family protein
MKLAKAWEEQGVQIPPPYSRCIKVLFAPDKEGVDELTLSHVILPPNGRTDAHTHDRPELIYVAAGEGLCVNEGKETRIVPDMALWVPAGEKHQLINTAAADLKIITVFVPAYHAQQNYARCLNAARHNVPNENRDQFLKLSLGYWRERLFARPSRRLMLPRWRWVFGPSVRWYVLAAPSADLKTTLLDELFARTAR